LLKVKAWRLTEKVNNKIEPYIIGLRKFTNDDVSPLLQVVKREGIEIPVTNRIGQPTPGLQGAPTFHPPVLFSVS